MTATAGGAGDSRREQRRRADAPEIAAPTAVETSRSAARPPPAGRLPTWSPPAEGAAARAKVVRYREYVTTWRGDAPGPDRPAGDRLEAYG